MTWCLNPSSNGSEDSCHIEKKSSAVNPDKSTNPPLDHTSSPLAPPFAPQGAELREKFVAARHPGTPRVIYHLYTTLPRSRQLAPGPYLQRTYASTDVACLDALGWLYEQHRQQERDVILCHYDDEEYKEALYKKCYKMFTVLVQARKWGKTFTVWATEELLLFLRFCRVHIFPV
jgi:hypothetical protein